MVHGRQLSLPPSYQRRTEYRVAAMRRRRKVSSIIKSKSLSCYGRSDWSNIPNGVIEKTHKLQLPDILRCRAVCSSWRSETLAHISSSSSSAITVKLPPPIVWQAPWRDYYFWFLDVARPVDNSLYHLNRRSQRLFFHKMGQCVGFSHGWFLFMDRKKRDTLCLFHPLLFSTAAARLPPIVTPRGFPPVLIQVGYDDDCEGVEKVLLWADPIFGNYGISIIHPCYKHIIFAKVGATQFTNLEFEEYDDLPPRIWHDIICFQNRIYGVTLTRDGKHHHMEAWDCASEDGPRKVLDFQPKFSSGKGPTSLSTLHLVESKGDLLLVSIQRPDVEKLPRRRVSVREIFVAARSPNMVRVYKMDFERMEWVDMDSIGDRVLFVMEHQNICVSADEFTQYRRNTVYFMHYFDILGCTGPLIGVFNMEDGSMTEINPNWQ